MTDRMVTHPDRLRCILNADSKPPPDQPERTGMLVTSGRTCSATVYFGYGRTGVALR
jgi:hypothetical protein